MEVSGRPSESSLCTVRSVSPGPPADFAELSGPHSLLHSVPSEHLISPTWSVDARGGHAAGVLPIVGWPRLESTGRGSGRRRGAHRRPLQLLLLAPDQWTTRTDGTRRRYHGCTPRSWYSSSSLGWWPRSAGRPLSSWRTSTGGAAAAEATLLVGRHRWLTLSSCSCLSARVAFAPSSSSALRAS